MKIKFIHISLVIVLLLFSFNIKSQIDTSYIIKYFLDNMVFVKGGKFQMGCTNEQKEYCNADEYPKHLVNVDDFYISKFELTQNAWLLIMETNPSNYKDCNDCPVDNVNWNEAQLFIEKLNNITGKKFRLPTESEWEYAAREGQNLSSYIYSGGDNMNNVGWYKGNSNNKPHPVGSKLPNRLGIFDMSGNVLEWCHDWYDSYGNTDSDNINKTETSSEKVYRGGSWFNEASKCRVSMRSSIHPKNRAYNLGFRLALSH